MNRKIAEMVSLFLIMLLMPLAICTANEYEPLTDIEVEEHLRSITWEELINEIRKLDIVEHEIPVVIFPDIMVIATDDTLTISAVDSQPVTASVGHLEWEIKYPEQIVEDFIYEDQKSYWYLWLAGGLAAGVVLGVFATK